MTHFGGGRSGGKTAKGEAAARDALRAGGQVFFVGRNGTSVMSLDADGTTLISTPLPPADPRAWRFDATTLELVNVADPSKRVSSLPDV